MDEGVIKYHCRWTEAPHGVHVPQQLLTWRDRMHERGLIGVYEADGIGYGNISIKTPEGMLISGTQTGHLSTLSADQYALVTQYSIAKNSLECRGKVKASAESLTHLAFYETNPSICAVVHVHHLKHWQRLMHQIPTSAVTVPYGTPEMAGEIGRLFKESDLIDQQIMVMGGHREGLISFGEDLDTAGEVMLNHCY